MGTLSAAGLAVFGVAMLDGGAGLNTPIAPTDGDLSETARPTGTHPGQASTGQASPGPPHPISTSPQVRQPASAATSQARPHVGDPFAGAVPDSMIQATLDEAGLTNVPPTVASSARAMAWTALAADLRLGGWRDPRRQAFAVTAVGTDRTTPTVVDVTLIWAAIAPSGTATDRQRTVVRIVRLTETSSWQFDSLR